MSRAWPVPAWARLAFLLSGARPWATRWRLSRQRTAPRISTRVLWSGGRPAPAQSCVTVETSGATTGATTGGADRGAAGGAPPGRGGPRGRGGGGGGGGGG